LKPGDDLVIDANPIVSALIGGKAGRIIERELFRLHSTLQTVVEIERNLPYISEKFKIPYSLLQSSLAVIPIKLHRLEDYVDSMEGAAKKIAPRDPKDVDILALAMALRCPIWTNDKDFDVSGVETMTTAEVLTFLL
jgi:predicted nucleic acid-binding protein